jgi:U3 small nucleolar RNA-associated protein MPP10
MKDGFFDLHDMEDFADEEEDYLPQVSYSKTESEKKQKKAQVTENKSFHQKQRDGDLLRRSDEDDDDDESFDGNYEEDEDPITRNKYRDDEDVEALYSMYQGGREDDREAEEAANMTAADFFGKPSAKHMERYKAQKAKEEIKGDDDSWGEYDFEQEGNDDEGRGRSRTDLNSAESGHSEEESDDAGSEEGDDTVENIKKETTRKVDSSRFAKQQEKLRKQTEQLEKDMLAEKPWQMTGETKSTTRPVNSLLEGTPEFEMASKQAPTITIEHTTNLEDVIKKRILAEDWDDVIPRELPDVGWHKKRGELPEVSQEKSKLGLGELYEREYLKKAVGYDKDADEKKTEEDKAKDEMKALFANLCSKLDGLSNYHFAPRPIADEAEVRTSNTPAIAMEEVLPLHVNDARGVAPEEVYATKRGREGVLRGESEMDQQERKRLRQSKKTARRKTRKDKLADAKLISRLQPGLGLNNPYEKRKIREDLAMARSKGKITTGEKDMDGKYGSSGTFFKRLQAEVQQNIRGNTEDQGERQKKPKAKSSALKL